jgi:uncharacterized protein (TIGR02270 family)
LWTLRSRAVGEPHYTLADLARLDERVEAHLDGARVAGAIGKKLCQENLTNQGPGEVFALAVLAFDAGDRDLMREALQAGCASLELRRGLVSALGWLEYSKVSRWIQMLLEARSASYRTVGIAAAAIHRENPGSALGSAIDDSDNLLRARSMRAVGELKRHDLLNHVRHHVHDQDPAAAFWAAWALTLNRDRAGLVNLVTWLEGENSFTHHALQLSLRAMPLEDSIRWVSSFAKDPSRRTSAVLGAGIVGDPAAMPWLIRTMASPQLARLAGEAFTMITGVDLAYYDLDQDAPTLSGDGESASLDEVLALTYESNLRWPSPEKIARWWQTNGARFSSGQRYLAGRHIDASSVRNVLVSGTQRQRAAAALELALMEPDRVLPEIRGRGTRQKERLSEWIS